MWGIVVGGVVPIYTLYFIKSPLKYGIYLSYLALLSIIVNFILGKITDKIKKQTVFIYPIAIAIAVTTFMFAVVELNLANWIILTGILQLISPIFSSLTVRLLVDNHNDMRLLMPGRELMLSGGRVLGLLLVFISFTFEKSPFYIFIVLGMAMLMYSILLFWKTKVLKICNFT